MKKYVNYGGIAGIVLILAGLIYYSLNAILDTIATILLIAGVVLVVAYAALNFGRIKLALSSRSARFGTNAIVMIIIVIGILSIINFVTHRFSWRADLTAAKQFSLATQTKKVLQHLKDDVRVIGFYKTGEEFRLQELLTEYSHYSPRLKFEFIDPDKKPGIAKGYGINAYGQIVVEYGGNSEKISKSTEEDITNAIIKVTREEQKKIYFLSGHGEKDYEGAEQSGYNTAKKAIEDENYLIDKVLLAEQENVPDDCSVLIVAGPKSDMFAHEQKMVNDYLKKGGKAMFLLDPDAKSGYGTFLKEWGIEVGNDLVVDASGIGRLFGAGPTIPIISQYESHEITKDFNVMTFFPEARSITPSDESKTGLTVKSLAKTSPRSWGETSSIAGMEKIVYDDGVDRKGPISIVALAEKDAENQPKNKDELGIGLGKVKTRIVVFGDSDFASNSYFNVQGNGDFFMNALSWLAEEEDLISVRPRDPEDRRVNLTQKQSRVILYVGVIFLPVAIFALGIGVYVRRK